MKELYLNVSKDIKKISLIFIYQAYFFNIKSD